MRRVAYALLAVALLAPSEPRAEMNPVTIISSGLKRPEIVLVLDTSGSMHQAPGSSSSIGTDCNKDSFGLVDLVGDGMCTGTETTSSSPNDCISSNSSTSPGQALACGGSATGTSRMFAVKRVLRGLLPALRTSANFGLVTFQQSGYYEYFKASGSCNCSTCPGSTTVVSCTYQNCSSASCDSGNPQWKNGSCSCGKNKPAPVCTNTTAVQPVCSDPEDCSTCSCPAATTRTCKNIGSPPCCSCGPGETLQCTNDGDCTTCTCRKSNWKAVGCCSCPTGFKMSDRCSETSDASKCRCYTGKEHNRHWRDATCNCPPPASTPVCAGSCPVISAASTASCTLAQKKVVSFFLSKIEMQARGLWVSGQPKATCNPASETCGWRDATQTTATWTGAKLTLLSAVPTDSGDPADAHLSDTNKLLDSLYRCATDGTKERRWRFADKGLTHDTSIDSCSSWEYVGSYYAYFQRGVASPQSSTRFGEYRGPQFTDDDGTTWVYRRFEPGSSSGGSQQGITPTNDGLVVVPIDASQEQTYQDRTVQTIMAHLNLARNGGIYPTGYTPTGPAIKAAGDHLLARQEGTAPFAADEKDYSAACRKRFVLVLTDGESNVSPDPASVAQKLYQGADYTGNYTGWDKLKKYSGLPDNPIKVLAVGLPGLSSYTELDDIADRGADGQDNNTPSAYKPTNESQLEAAIRSAIYDAIRGDYVTTSLGVASTNGNAQGLAIVPSTEFPGWRGQLRAYDIQAAGTPSEVWSAGDLLASGDPDANFRTRPIYTGYPSSGTSSGSPIPIFNVDGSVNLTAVKAAVAAAGGSLPGTDATQTRMLEWLAGKGRSWRLGPIMGSTPATVSAQPPAYSGLAVSKREELVYVTTHDGLLHAFRSKTGVEMFAYVPPNLLPRIYQMWAANSTEQRQDEDPNNFTWILGSSPRVQDVPKCTTSGCTWQTHLAVTMGAAANRFVVLDVTNPVDCSSGTCTLNGANFFKVVAHSNTSNALDSKMGGTWSLPSYFYTGTGTTQKAHMALGSGYPVSSSPPAGQGQYYFHFGDVFSASVPYAAFDTPVQHTNPGALVDYAVIAGTAAAVDGNNIGDATYQADLGGSVVRYPLGGASGKTTIISAGVSHPFYYGPAVLKTSSATYLAAVSGSAAERNEASGVESKIFVMKDNSSLLSLAVGDLCTQFSGVTTNCPSTRARPVGSPLLLENKPDSSTTRIEAIILVYDPPPETEPCQSGYSYTIRLQIDKTSGGSTSNKLLSVRKDEGRAGGLSIVGGGSNIAIALSGKGNDKPTIVKVVDTALTSPPTSSPKVLTESWREVR